jgi:16S rRNA (guanine527-N7)-methyltransferase
MAKDSGVAGDFPFPSAELLERGLAELGFPVDDGTVLTDGAIDGGIVGDRSGVSVRGRSSLIPLFNRYIRELELFNAVFDLVGAESGTERGRSDLVVRHILDSLAPWKRIASLVSERTSACDRPFAERSPAGDAPAGGLSGNIVELADAGSGAGFPGLPLAIAFPDIRVTLVERMSKRCAFLENCVAMLKLANVTVLNGEVERAPEGRFDIVAFRAFRPLDAEMTRTLLRMVRTDGVLAAWKAKRDKIVLEMDGLVDVVSEWNAYPTPVPFLGHEERHLVVIS